MTNRLLRAAAIATLLTASSGCSIALMDKPRSDRGVAVKADCTTSNAYWLADGVGVLLGVAAVATGIYLGTDNQAKAGNVTGGVGALGAVVYGASMGSGVRWARECREQRSSGAAMTVGR